jgi:hypothetical protein
MNFLSCAGFVLTFWLAFAATPGIAAPADEKPADEKPADDKPADGASEALSDFEETWQVVYISKSRVGHQRSSSGRLSRDGREVIVTDTEMAIAISRLGQPVKIKTVVKTQETPGGDLLGFQYEMQNPPAAPTKTTGRVEGDKLVITTETNGKASTKEIAWDNTIKSPAFQDRLLRENPLKPGEKRIIKSFEPQFLKEHTTTLQAGGAELRDVKMLDGKIRKLLEVKVTDSLMPIMSAYAYLDDKGMALKTKESLLNMETYAVAKQEALKAVSGAEVDLAIATLIKTGKIERSQQTRQVVYRVHVPGEDPEAVVAKGPTQLIVRVDPNTVDLTVRSIAPPETAPENIDPPGKEFLLPNSYLQSDDELVKKHASDAVGGETDSWKAAQLMEHWVWEHLKNKNFSTLLASAAEVAKDLSGDCTEHAVLLAAMCRSRGIPSRVAVGLLYVPSLSSFGGHMWTEVFEKGTWIPLDATLGKGGIAADHIKFADSSFSDDGESTPITAFLPMVSALGKMKIEVREFKHDK